MSSTYNDPESAPASTNAAVALPAPPPTGVLSPSDQDFVLALVRNAVVLGITDVEYRGLRVRISPSAAREGQKHSIAGYTSGNWSAPVVKAGAK